MPLHIDGGPLMIGSTFADKYEIKGLLGQGGQAWVYRGQHTFTGREVAIKIIHSPGGVTREMLDRAKGEAQALAKLNHKNVVIMHDAGVTAEGQLYILMELLEGCSLGAVLKAHGRLEIAEILRLAIQAADAVHEAHKRRIIHRDLKPDNLFVIRGDHAGDGNPLKVLDFGIAKMLDEIGFTTRKDVVIGTVLYMSPEQVQGLPITEQSDIYALGLIIWEALIGKRPSVLIFERDLIERGLPHRRPGIADIPPIQAHSIPPLLTELDPEIPLYVAQLVQRAIAKVARQRFATMGDFAAALRVCLDKYLREVPLHVRRPSGRDLSQFAPKPPEAAPVSQRVTAKHPASASPSSAQAVSAAGTARIELPVALQNTLDMKPASLPRAASSSSSPVGIEPIGTSLPVAVRAQPARSTSRPESHRERGASQPFPVASAAKAVQAAPNTKPPASGPLKPGTPQPVAIDPRQMRSAVGHANRMRIWSALGSAGLLGVVLGTALMRFVPTSHEASLPSAAAAAVSLASVSPNPNATRLRSAPGPAANTDVRGAAAAATTTVASTVPSPAALAPAAQGPIPTAHVIAKPTKAAAPKPVDKMDQRLIELQNDLGNDQSTSPKPGASATQSKSWVQPREDRKKAIYGD